jgi:hypothetical protein
MGISALKALACPENGGNIWDSTQKQMGTRRGRQKWAGLEPGGLTLPQGRSRPAVARSSAAAEVREAGGERMRSGFIDKTGAWPC